MKKRIAILGSTGSIGTQTLDVIREHPEYFEAHTLTAGKNADLLIKQALEFLPDTVVIADESKYDHVKEALSPYPVKVYAGNNALCEVVASSEIDTVVTAMVGFSGLRPTISALKAHKCIALANKETLVVAGELITGLLASSSSRVFPVDSEHSAIAQCLRGEDPATVRRLIITASGGPFRTWTAERMLTARAADALNHPNWSMGAKITVDSATMMNKAFEIIEARYLFGIDAGRIKALVHPQSIVHSMVEFTDGAIKAQLGVPDMHVPIAYALGENSRLADAAPALTLEQMSSLTFEQPDPERFPCLTLAHTALERGGNVACTINGANEVAVDAFLHDRIAFPDIYNIICRTLDSVPFVASPGYDDLVATNAEARRIASELISH